MNHIFLTASDVEPDLGLVHAIEDDLRARQHYIFIGTPARVGSKGMSEIEEQLQAADFFIVLLSKDSIRNEMIWYAIQRARQYQQEDNRKPTILPIRVAFDGALPQEIAGILDPLDQPFWQPGDAYDSMITHVNRGMQKARDLAEPGESYEEETSLAGVKRLFDETEGAGAPLPAADPRFHEITGSIKQDSSFYIERDTDAKLLNQLQFQGTIAIIKGARQMGKSSLLARAHAEARKNNWRIFYLDFQLIDESNLENLNALLKYISRRIIRTFKLNAKIEDFWKNSTSPVENFLNFIEDKILLESEPPVVFLFDEADRVFNYELYRDQFFATIRGWYNRRNTHETWNRLSVVIAHSTEPHLWIQDLNQSPFNVGLSLKLEDLYFNQVAEFNKRHGTPLKTEKEIEELMSLVGGQPYLTRRALYILVTNKWKISQLNKIATNEGSCFSDHLQRYLWILHEKKI